MAFTVGGNHKQNGTIYQTGQTAPDEGLCCLLSLSLVPVIWCGHSLVYGCICVYYSYPGIWVPSYGRLRHCHMVIVVCLLCEKIAGIRLMVHHRADRRWKPKTLDSVFNVIHVVFVTFMTHIYIIFVKTSQNSAVTMCTVYLCSLLNVATFLGSKTY